MAHDPDERRRESSKATRRTFPRATGALGATLPFLTGVGSATTDEDGGVDVAALVAESKGKERGPDCGSDADCADRGKTGDRGESDEGA